jgi:photosynthetic reaction center cytochrome c subunit
MRLSSKTFSAKKTFAKRPAVLLTASLILAAFAILAAQAQAPAAAPAQGEQKTTDQQFKNIKVLKGLPADQLIPAMQFMTASLGVECEFCHVRKERGLAFEKDDKKPKEVARKMIEMMWAINKDNFEGKREVTCYSCHRGAAHPVGTPIVAEEGAKPEVPVTGEEKKPDASTLPTAEQVFDKYLAASGGAAAVEKITSRVQKGTLSGFGESRFPVDIYAKAPDKRVSIMHLPGGDSTTAYDGHSGWMLVPGRPPHIMNADENSGARIDADFHLPADVKTLSQKWTPAPGETIDGHPTNLIVGRTDDQPPIRLYFDAQSSLLVRMIRYNETPLGRMPTQVDYSDYRDADGVKVPYRWSISRPGNRFSIQVDELHQNVPIDDAKFAAPPPPPPPPQSH